MKILALTHMYPPHHYGGYELLCRDILERFEERGHRWTMLTSDLRVPGAPVTPDPRVRRELHLYWEDHRIVRPPLHRRWRRERDNQAALRRALAAARPDVISVWHMGAMSLGLLTALSRTNIPIVYVVCDDWLTYAKRMDSWTSVVGRLRGAERLLRVPCTAPDIGVTGTFGFISEDTRATAERDSPWGYPDSTIVYAGIDTRDFPPQPRRDREWAWRLLCVGRIDPRKGIDTAIRALAQLPPEATLTIVGRGDEAHLTELHRLGDELGVSGRVRWSIAERGNLAAVYAAADVLLFPVTWNEPFGLVPLEAMSCGTPVVATGTGGSGEFLIDGWDCMRFAAGDADALAAAVRRLAESPSTREQIIEGGRVAAAELTMDRWADVLEQWHIAAASRFADGRPVERPRLSQVLGTASR